MELPDLKTLTLSQAKASLANGEYSVAELIESHLDAIKQHDGDIHAFLEVFDDVRAQATASGERIQNGTARILEGIPIAIKDNIVIAGKSATAGSKILEGYIAPYTATAVQKLIDAGAIIIGRANMDEFAMGSSTEKSAYGPTKNPLDLTRVPGGSSGGSAAATAAGFSVAALGSDTGGSIRQPAAFCGLVGLKPTYGSVSRHGLIAMGSSLDVIGTFSKSVADAELLYSVIQGEDAMDSTTVPDKATRVTKQGLFTIGVPRNFIPEEMDGEVRANFEAALEKFRSLGHSIIDIELATVPRSLAVYYVIMPAEASTNLSRFEGVRYGLHKDGGSMFNDMSATRTEGFGPEPRRRILLGTYVLSSGYYDAYYGKAVAVRTLIKQEFAAAFAKVDLIATPTTPSPAFKFGEKSDPLSMYLEDIFTVPANIAGIPAISLPSGTVTRDGSTLPLGIQLMAPHSGESMLFQAGKEFLGE